MHISISKFALLNLVIATLFVSCKGSGPQIQSFVDANDSAIDSINSVVLQQSIGTTNQNPIGATGGKGYQQKAFEAWFKQCASAQTWKKPVYLGVTNPYYLGSILTTDLKNNKYDFSKVISDTNIYKKFVTLGVNTSACDLNQMKDFNLNFFVSGNLWSALSAKLQSAIKTAKSITITTGDWSIDYLDDVQFKNYLNASKDTDVIQYREYLATTSNLVITKVVKISGFNAKICTSSDIVDTVGVNLLNGFSSLSVTPTDSTKKIGFSLNFSITSKDTITVSSKGVFYALGQLSEAQIIGK